MVRVIERAAQQGDRLVVGVSSDALNMSKKGREPVFSQAERLAIVAALKPVDEVFLEESLELKRHYIEQYAADVLVMGDDWAGRFDEFKDICEVVYLPRTPAISTTALIVEGCVMMRVCHLDTCPVGIATQNPVLRKRFTGRPEFVENFFVFLAEEVRGYLAQLGFRSLDEAVGHVELLDVRPAVAHWKAQGLDLAPLLHLPAAGPDTVRRRVTTQDHRLRRALDNELIAAARPALEAGTPVPIPMRPDAE